MMKKKQVSSAFTLIEVVIGVTLMAFVIVALTALVLTTLSANRRNIQSVQAVYLAQEGIESMRFIRDSNWLQNYAWDQGLGIWGDNFALNEFQTEKTLYLGEQTACPPCIGFKNQIETISFSNMEFERSILVKRAYDEDGFEMENIYEVVALVEWQDRGRDRKYELSTFLSDWK